MDYDAPRNPTPKVLQMTALALDLETIPTLAALANPYPEDSRHPPASYTKPETILAWREKDRASWQEDRLKGYSLNPLFGRIVAVGRATLVPGSTEVDRDSLTAPLESDERELVARLWESIAGASLTVTWNGIGFDVPFLLTRSALLGVPRPVGVDVSQMMRRYSSYPHYDVKAMVCQWDNTKMRDHTGSYGLDAWATAFGLAGKVSHGSQVYGMHLAGQHEAIGAYAADDAAKTLALYERVRTYLQ